MPTDEDSIVVEIADDFRQVQLDRRRLKKMVRTVCQRFGVRQATISIAVLCDEAIHKINKQFLNRDSTTDVISFNLSETGKAKTFEVVVNGRRAEHEAESRGHNAESELALYVLHGLLHNLGFDDASRQEAQRMHKTEDEILQQFGYGTVFGS